MKKIFFSAALSVVIFSAGCQSVEPVQTENNTSGTRPDDNVAINNVGNISTSDWIEASHDFLKLSFKYDPTIFRIDKTGEEGNVSDIATPATMTLETYEAITYIDPISKQELTEPLMRVTVARNENPDRFLPFYRKLDNEVSWSRFDVDGFAGYRLWNWFVQNAYHSSLITYAFHRGDHVLEIQAWIVEDDPDSATFQRMESIFDRMMMTLALSSEGSTKQEKAFERTIRPQIQIPQ